MTKRYLRLLLALVLAFSMVLGMAPASFAEGAEGTVPDPESTLPAGEGEAAPAADEKTYTVTYTNGQGRFEDQVYTVKEGEPVPAFQGGLMYDGYLLTTWNGKYKASEPINETVTANRTFSARWTSTPSPLDEAAALNQGTVRLTDEFRPNGAYDPRAIRLVPGSFTVGETTWDGSKYIATITITDVKPYEEALSAAVKQYGDFKYVFNSEETPEENLTIHFASKLSWKGNGQSSNLSASFGKWMLDTSYYPSAYRSQLLFNRAYSVTFKDGADGSVFAEKTLDVIETVKDAASIAAFEVPARPGYTFTGWLAESGTLTEDGEAVTSDAVLVAQWEKNSYTLSFDAAGGSPAEAKTLSYGDALGELPVSTREGYVFDGWYYADGTKASAEDLFTADEDIALTAQWTQETYTLSFNAEGGDTIEPKQVSPGKPVGELPTPTRKGYTFEGWYYADGAKASAEDVYNAKGDMELTAKWTANTYVIRFDPNGGKVDVTEKKVTFGEKLGELPVPTKEGCKFAGWCDNDGNLYLANTIYSIDGDVAVFACWVDPSVNPKTGDDANALLYGALMLGSLAAATYVTMQLKKRRDN